LVELMGGTISVKSEAGKGSTFHFTIRTQAAPSSPTKSGDANRARLVGRRLLIVKENETGRSLLLTLARRWGMEAVPLASGIEALKRLEAGEKFDAAVIDQDMPPIDNQTIAAALRCFPQSKNIPFILLTSGDQPKPAGLGFFNVLSKPWKSSALQRELIRMLGPDAALPVAAITPDRVLEPQALEETPFRVLVVEDNLTNLQVVITVLRALGFQPDIAENGRLALEKLAVKRYDLILLDIQMPEIDGLAVARHVRAKLNTSPPTIVAITAGVTPEDRQKCFDAGMDDFIMKPFKISTLKDIILKYARPPNGK